MTTQERQRAADARRTNGEKRQIDWQESCSLGPWNRPEQFHLRKREGTCAICRLFPSTLLKSTEATGAHGRIGMCGADQRSAHPRSNCPFQRANHKTDAFHERRKRAFI